jgi:hypothetical protein
MSRSLDVILLATLNRTNDSLSRAECCRTSVVRKWYRDFHRVVIDSSICSKRKDKREEHLADSLVQWSRVPVDHPK